VYDYVNGNNIARLILLTDVFISIIGHLRVEMITIEHLINLLIFPNNFYIYPPGQYLSPIYVW